MRAKVRATETAHRLSRVLVIEPTDHMTRAQLPSLRSVSEGVWGEIILDPDTPEILIWRGLGKMTLETRNLRG